MAKKYTCKECNHEFMNPIDDKILRTHIFEQHKATNIILRSELLNWYTVMEYGKYRDDA